MAFFNQTTFPYLLAALVLAVAIAAFYAYDSRTVLGALVRALYKAQAFSESTARTFAELSLDPGKRFAHALRETSSLSSVVACTEPRRRAKRQLGKKQSPFDFSTARFYLPEKTLEKARHTYLTHVGGLLAPILITLGALAVGVALYFLLPLVIQLPA